MRLLGLCVVALLAAPGMVGGQAEKPKVRVAVVIDGPSPVFDSAIDALSVEVRSQLSDRFDVDLVGLSVEADWTPEGVQRQLDAAYADPEIAVVFGLGTLTLRAVAALKTIPKPTILPFVVEAERQGLPRRGDVSGRKNLCYVTEPLDVTDEAGWLSKVAGSKRIAFLAERSEEAVLPVVIQKKQLELVVADPIVEALVAAIPTTADGVILSPMRRLSLDDRQRLIAFVNQRRLPNIAVDPSWLDQGAMMSIRSPENQTRRAQRAALDLDLILEGRPASEIHVDFEVREDLQINVEAAMSIGVRPTFEVLLEAEVVDEEEVEPESQISMEVAMLEAVENNLDLLVSERFVEAGEELVKRERGSLLPQGQLETGVVMRDPDRVFTGGQIAERQASTFARASQSIYSEEAWKRFKASKLRQEGREYGYFTDVLDIMLESGAAYVGVLRAKAQERIQRRNIRLTREYLGLARLRLEVGVANSSEVYRWQAQLAENQQALVEARAFVGQAKIELNRVRNRPLEQPVAPLDLPLDELGLVSAPADAIDKYMQDPWSFELLRDFMADEGLRNSPEFKQTERRKAAQQRLKEGFARELWLPHFFVDGGIQHDYWRDGKGATTPENDLGLPQPDKFGWDVGLFLAIPLSRGGSGVAAMRGSAILVERLAAELDRIAQNIDTEVRTELYSAGAALASVRLTRNAAEAASNNLELVVDLYQRGKVDIIRLIDAQTQSLIANLAAANAAYDYMLALLFVNRAIRHFRNLDDPESKQDFSRRLNEFIMAVEAGAQSAPPAP